ncbi:serine/threonine protein kinase [Calothrix sp. HK-06]|nr:serine/threonine protein kinase [Calothrix sp. HK-06]
MSTPVSIPGYQISEQLYDGSRTLVYRGFREIDSVPVVIKLLKNPYPSFSELLQFRNQYTIAKNLSFPGIIQTYSLEPFQNGYVLVMEDFGGISLKDYFTNNNIPSLEEFLQIAIYLCDTLDILYRHRTIHKDIKPSNILINPETKQVKLIDFSIASLLPRESQEIKSPNVLEGTLTYISPEQTGRMNRGIDYRSDFYSLGVTFYELLTGKLPFICDDAMELVHCHIAKMPPSINSDKIPEVLNNIIHKLMAKNAEDRYQSTLGLKHDLEKCLAQLEKNGKILFFEIAQRDICDRFIIPEKLYGREKEVQKLLDTFERVSNGKTEIMVVEGFSGIGKTAVVNEVHKPIIKQRGYFIKGKFDQFKRNIPFSAFVQAFRSFIEQLLTESDTQNQLWRTKILDALGENGQVIIEVIPELERIIGQQPAVGELSGTAAQNRFNLLFQNFLQVFTTPEHPLVIFLDDLQWADSASLKLMQLLTDKSSSQGYLLLIGAYRNNEVFPAHPLMITLDEITKVGTVINTITLEPLSQNSLNQLATDTLNCTADVTQPLTELIYQKTQGNPFFSSQFLKALYEDGLISFNLDAGYWQCDITKVRETALTDDVVEFMALQLQKLPEATRNALKLAACVGNQFDLATLAIVSEQSEMETATALWKALQEGLILPQSEVYKFYLGIQEQANQQGVHQIVNYKFLHDRVQQAAYSLIPEEKKQATHLKIGQLLQDNLSDIEREEKLFDIIGHLNLGIELITQPRQKEDLAQLNLAAGQKARNSTAYSAARTFVQTGLELLTANCWESQYELTLNLHVLATETAYLNGDLEGMEKMALKVLQEAQMVLDKVKVYEIQIGAQTLQSNVLEAVTIGRKALGQLGIQLPDEPDETEIDKALQTLANQLKNIEVEELIDLPLTTDATIQAAMQLMGMLFAPIIQGMPRLLPWLSSTMVSLSLQSGNSVASTIGYAIHGMVMSAFLGDAVAGYAFGKLAINLLEKFNIQDNKAIVMFLFGSFIQHRQERLNATIPILKIAYHTGIETGNFSYAGYSLATHSNAKFFGGAELGSFVKNMADYSMALAQVKQYSAQVYVDLAKQVAENLIESVSQPHCLIGNGYDETVMIPKHHQDNDFTALAEVYLYKLLLAYSFDDYTVAINYVAEFKLYFMALSGTLYVPIFHLYAALTYLALFPTQPEHQQAEILAQLETHQTMLHQWAQNAPMNYLHKWYLVEAEKQRVLENKVGAFEMYERAIQGAKENGFIQEEALANELTAKFYLNWGKEKVAAGYMQEAYYCYAKWGAKGKIDDLEKRYPQLLKLILQQRQFTLNPWETIANIPFPRTSSSANTSTASSTSISDALDFTSILKAAQTISSSIELDQLVTSLTKIILENSGAKKSVLILPQENTWQIRAITSVNYQDSSQGEIETIFNPQLLDICQDIPRKVINYVKNTQKYLVINNCQTDIPGVIGRYILDYQPKSILCTPIINQGHLVGILYLENKLTSGVFTQERLQVINLISSQAAISLENARLYQQSQQALQNLQQAQLQIVQSEKMSALGNLVAGVAHEMNNPLGFISASLKQAKPILTDIVDHLKLYQKSLKNPDEEILAHAEKIDLDYGLEDLPKIIDAMVMACDRLKNISTSLRTFSRADKDYKVTFNVHDGIDSTILILKHRLKANELRPAIEVVKEYGNLPQVQCFPGQLNQVFINILANAIDALEESNIGHSFDDIKANPNRITISTLIENDRVKISIADNGKGISESIKSKIFDHLFTTKDIGKGTGLGLAIAKQIIEETHGGKLNCNSVLGQGTEFIIEMSM